jgi:hypothetical protein
MSASVQGVPDVTEKTAEGVNAPLCTDVANAVSNATVNTQRLHVGTAVQLRLAWSNYRNYVGTIVQPQTHLFVYLRLNSHC